MNGSTDGALDALNVSTFRHIRRSPILIDGIFQSDAVMAMMKKTCMEKYTGGRVIAGNFDFDTILGGGYNRGEDFDTSEQKIDDQIQVFPKFMAGNITTDLEMVEVLNTGDNAVYKDVDSKLSNLYKSMGSWLAIQLRLPNARTGFDRFITGFAETHTDGVTSWDAGTYTTYGGLTRSSYYGALMAYAVSLSGAQIEYDDLTDAIQEVSWGDGEWEPNVFDFTPKGFNSVKKRFQVQQRLNESTPVIGFKGFALENTTALKSRYTPGQDIVTANKKSNRVAAKFIRATARTTVLSSLTQGYPSVTNETAFLHNLRKPNCHLYTSTARRYQFGFTGWKLYGNNTKVSGQGLWSGQFMCDNPSFFGQIVNFT